ncbi:HNH endonuclease signature motif containing protein [Blastococcus sp. CCUG 61487]|uniref:HNH endonuclease signature motif containing protein n=1 Tax=Blastococcus sp. CCUG 61487 TaxID=1840703 RepID=UPI00201E03B5|nr:HNH endonuclease signature motif containing protein [Blastococcus sp. CCUG 61487]
MEGQPLDTLASAAAAGGGAPVAGWASGPLGVVQELDREITRLTAARARAVAEFAASRPASADRQPGEPGAMSAARRAARPEVLAGVSEWAVPELSIALAVSKQAAGLDLERSLTLVTRLPGTLAALESGLLHTGHLWALRERVAVIADDDRRAALERDVLAWVAARAARREITTPAQLADKLRRMGLGRDPKQEAEELVAGLRARGVWARRDRRAGMAVLESLLTAPEAHAVVDALGRYADALPEDPADARTRGQKMADVLLDLVLRPGESSLPPVQAQLTLVAGVRALLGGSAPGQVGGETVPAEMVRALARALGLLTVPAPDTATATGQPEPDKPPVPFVDPGGRPDDTWPAQVRADFDRWEAELDARALAGVWGGEDDPPPEVQQAWWDEEARRHTHQGTDHPDDGPPTTPEPAPGPTATTPATATPATTTAAPTTTGLRAAARAAAEQADLALLRFDQALRRASAAAGRAWLDDRGDESAAEATGAHRIDGARSDLDALRAATDQQRAELAALLDRTAGGGLVDRPRIAVVDELTGALLALTDARELRRRAHCGRPACTRAPQTCGHDLTARPGLGPPPATDGYRPATALDRYLRARDSHCRFPGCRRPVARGELDHHTPWPHGPTSAANLTGYCTGDHRGKHQAPGWAYDLTDDGTLTVTTPSGLTATTTPPPF